MSPEPERRSRSRSRSRRQGGDGEDKARPRSAASDRRDSNASPAPSSDHTKSPARLTKVKAVAKVQQNGSAAADNKKSAQKANIGPMSRSEVAVNLPKRSVTKTKSSEFKRSGTSTPPLCNSPQRLSLKAPDKSNHSNQGSPRRDARKNNVMTQSADSVILKTLTVKKQVRLQVVR